MTTIGESFEKIDSPPLATPTAAPARTPASTATVTGVPLSRRLALVMPPRPMIEPTDRSMPPLMSNRASGTETIPMIETCSNTRRKLSKLTNLSFWLAKNKTSS